MRDDGRFDSDCVTPFAMWHFAKDDQELPEGYTDPTNHILGCKMCQNLYKIYGGDLTQLEEAKSEQ